MVWAAGASPTITDAVTAGRGSKANGVTQLFLNTVFTIEGTLIIYYTSYINNSNENRNDDSQ